MNRVIKFIYLPVLLAMVFPSVGDVNSSESPSKRELIKEIRMLSKDLEVMSKEKYKLIEKNFKEDLGLAKKKEKKRIREAKELNKLTPEINKIFQDQLKQANADFHVQKSMASLEKGKKKQELLKQATLAKEKAIEEAIKLRDALSQDIGSMNDKINNAEDEFETSKEGLSNKMEKAKMSLAYVREVIANAKEIGKKLSTDDSEKTFNELLEIKSTLKNYLSILGFTGFDYSKHSIPLDEIMEGGPPKDGIPALFYPDLVNSDEVDFVLPEDRVIGISLDGESRAYPIRILNWHELVNDIVGDKPIVVTYCPLCGTGMVFLASINGQQKLYGVSGKLYMNDMLFYDRETESLWSQIKMEAVTGPMTGEKLQLLPATHTTWKKWKEKHPDTKVLSVKTGYERDYGQDPYKSYGMSDVLAFPLKKNDERLSKKAWVAGVIINGKAKAYPFDHLSEKPVQDNVGGKHIIVKHDSINRSVEITDTEGSLLPYVQSYWFAWAAFYPDTEIYQK